MEIIESKSGLNYIGFAASKLETELIVSMGKTPTSLFLLLKNNAKFSSYIEKCYNINLLKRSMKLIPCLDAGYVLNNSQAEIDSVARCFELARKEIFGCQSLSTEK